VTPQVLAVSPLETVAACDLLAMDLAPLQWAIDRLIAEGLTGLIAAPKIGKSWLGYQLGVAVSTGGCVLGRQARKGDVLYLALEDGVRRARDRITLILRHLGESWPADASALDVAFNSERGDALVAQIEAWLAEHPEAVLVLIDTLQRVRPSGGGRRTQYELDVEDISRIQAITQRHPGLSIIVIHHARKLASVDFVDATGGTNGIAGSFDSTLFLKRDRHQRQGSLEITGRDVREERIYVAYAEDDPYWELDPAGGLTGQELEAWRWIETNGASGPTAVGAGLGIDKTNAHRALKGLVAKGALKGMAGTYDLAIRVKRSSVDNFDNRESTVNN
jgi:AAA domain